MAISLRDLDKPDVAAGGLRGIDGLPQIARGLEHVGGHVGRGLGVGVASRHSLPSDLARRVEDIQREIDAHGALEESGSLVSPKQADLEDHVGASTNAPERLRPDARHAAGGRLGSPR